MPTNVGRPDAPPDVALGAQIYAEHCTRCHGIDGKGDGELVQTGEVPRPLDFTDPATSGSQRPDTWFNTITNGNVEHLMPPGATSLPTPSAGRSPSTPTPCPTPASRSSTGASCSPPTASSVTAKAAQATASAPTRSPPSPPT
ncbi:MAG: c-type cytochrome [Anaerolineae bacterium]